MTNPYAAPGVDQDLLIAKPGRLFPLVALALGLAWWAVLLLPEVTREILLDGGQGKVAWGFARVVGLVTGACLLFRKLRWTWPRLRWLSAVGCLWAGSAAFAATIVPFDTGGAMLPFVALAAPFFFLMAAWYVALPMTALTVVVLSWFDRPAAVALEP